MFDGVLMWGTPIVTGHDPAPPIENTPLQKPWWMYLGMKPHVTPYNGRGFYMNGGWD